MRLSIFVLMILPNLLYGCSLSRSAMIRSAGSGDVATMTMLYKEGANLDERDKMGRTPLMHALWGIRTDAAKYLINAGADLKAKDNNGCDILMYAADYYQPEIVSILINKGVSVNTRDNEGKTPLIHAVIAENIDSVKALIKGGADVNAVFNENETAFSMARYLEEKHIQDELLNAGAIQIETAKLTFIREFNPIYMLAPTYISIRNLTTITIKNGDKKSIEVNPGKCNLEIDALRWQGQQKLSFEAKAGKTYYFKISPRTGAGVSGLLGRELGQYIESKYSDNPGPFELTPISEYIDKFF